MPITMDGTPLSVSDAKRTTDASRVEGYSAR